MNEEEKKAIEELEEFIKGPCEICKYCKGAYKLNRKNIIRLLNLTKKLQKENEELKADNYELNNRINDLLDNISVQKVKDKIRHYQELQDNYIKKYDEINEGLQAMINVLQELLEGKNKMCEYCKLFSGDRITLAEDGETELKIERHNKEYSLVAEGLTDIAETRINYCPMCGRKLKED